MIFSRKPVGTEEVAGHYDELDRYYRDVWGNHLHHGLWLNGNETVDEAVLNLARLIAERAQVTDRSRVCDVGCGYGATAGWIATHLGASVTGITLSKKQFQIARENHSGPDAEFLLCDWAKNSFETSSFDAVIAIESLSHMSDKQQFFDEAFRVLKPGGRLVCAIWLAVADPAHWQVRWLLEPICREGRLPGMANRFEIIAMSEKAGFQIDAFPDLSRHVARTWWICLSRVLARVACRKDYRNYLFNPASIHREFAGALLRLCFAYPARAMHYGMLVAERL